MIQFDRMTQWDLPVVIEIENEVAIAPWSQGIFQDCLRSGYQGYMLRDDDITIGFSMYSIAVGECHLLNLAICKDHQGKGYGKRFLDFLIDNAAEQGAGQMFLEVRASNHIAQQLYLSRGFNEIDLRKNYYPAANGREDALIFALELFPV